MKGDVHTLWKMSQPCKLVQILHPREVDPSPKYPSGDFFKTAAMR